LKEKRHLRMHFYHSFAIKNVTKSYGDHRIIENISFGVNQGEVFSVVGKSGTGKSTLIQVCAGLLEPEEGHVFWEGNDITGKRGKCGMMFQDDLLLPWFTVIDNIRLGLKIKGKKMKDYDLEIKKLLEKFDLKGAEEKYPNQISGGMQKRVALLRTYMASYINSEDNQNSPLPLLLDEPFAGLDEMTKKTIQNWLIQIRQEINSGIIFITHDIREAMLLSDWIIVLSGSPAKLVKEINMKKRSESDEVIYRGIVDAL
jgi:ABC-type nitrate/sulfonate/bicarbonate transport system ATPase subunit